MSRFAMVPESALRGLNKHDLPVYVALRLHADERGDCWPSQATLADLTGLSRTSVQTRLEALRVQGWLEWERQKGGVNRYRLRDSLPAKSTGHLPAKSGVSNPAKLLPAAALAGRRRL